MNNLASLNIGLFGFGTVGESLYGVLHHTPSLQATIKRVCIKHPEKPRKAPAELFTTDASDILTDPDINVVVEFIDDADAAYAIVKSALTAGKAVVSANKKLIAEHLPELLELQRRHDAPFLYESAVCASIPVVRNLEEYYDNDLLHGLQGIVNGSTNYILTKVAEEGKTFDEALRAAQKAGFAESDPSLDVNGIDAVNKLTILLAHAYGIVAEPGAILHSGIQHLHPSDAALAREKGYVIKLIAQARKLKSGKVAAAVLPQFLPARHLLARVENEYNAVIIESGLAEAQAFFGKGAGGVATASAVLSDLSALRYGYRYEYKKRYHAKPAEATDDFYLRVHVSFDSAQPIPLEHFERIEEWAGNGERAWVTGVLHCSRLRESRWWQRAGVSLILHPEAILEAPPAADKSRIHSLLQQLHTTSTSTHKTNNTVTDITTEELKRRSDAGERLTVIDVREPHEYAEANIGALHIPLGTILAGSFEAIPAGRDEEIILQCRSGKRSADAARFLESAGYTNTRNLVGGILDWQEKFGNARLRTPSIAEPSLS